METYGPKPDRKPNQLTLEDLKAAQLPLRVRYCYGYGDGKQFHEYTVLSIDFDLGRCEAVCHRGSWDNENDYFHLCDCGVIPYEDGRWNQWNWLELAEPNADTPVIYENR